MSARITAAASLLALTLAAPALASTQDYAARLCGAAPCANAASVQSAVPGVWAALRRMGTTEFLGGNLAGVHLDEAALLAGAQTVGPVTFDHLLRTGALATSDPADSEVMLKAMTATSGTDLSAVTGQKTTAPRVASAALPSGASGGGSSGACDAGVAELQTASAARYIEDVNNLAGSAAGFSRLDGQGAQASMERDIGSKSGKKQQSLFGLSCLQRVMTEPNLDSFFKPPGMQQIVNQAGEAACDKAMSAIADLQKPVNPHILDTASMGGFFPGMNVASLGGTLKGGVDADKVGSLLKNYGRGDGAGRVTGGLGDLFGG